LNRQSGTPHLEFVEVIVDFLGTFVMTKLIRTQRTLMT
jgi:hypothetical protein